MEPEPSARREVLGGLAALAGFGAFMFLATGGRIGLHDPALKGSGLPAHPHGLPGEGQQVVGPAGATTLEVVMTGVTWGRVADGVSVGMAITNRGARSYILGPRAIRLLDEELTPIPLASIRLTAGAGPTVPRVALPPKASRSVGIRCRLADQASRSVGAIEVAGMRWWLR